MPVTVNSVTYYHFRGGAVVDSAGNPVENLTGGQVYLPGGATPLALLSYPGQVALTELVSSEHGLIADFYAAIPANVDPDVFIDWPGDTIPAQPVDIATAELRALIKADVLAAVPDLEPRVVALEGTAADLPTKYVQVHPHNQAAGVRMGIAGGAHGFPASGDLNATTDVFDVIGA